MTAQAAVVEETSAILVERHGETERTRITRGIRQALSHWQEQDGSTQEFSLFCLEHFVPQGAELEVLRQRFQQHLESLLGNLHRSYRDLNWMLHVDAGEMQPVDQLFANYDVFAHVQEDFFASKVAFVALLNFPLFSLEEKSREGLHWSREEWADARLADKFTARVPGEVRQRCTVAYSAAEEYVYSYNIYMHNVLDEQGSRLFPPDLKLISHWGLRDEIKARYADPEGLPHQRLIQQVIERIIRQEIPRSVINNPLVDWKPASNIATQHQSGELVNAAPEGNRRYQVLREVFLAEREIDAYTPHTPSLIDRRFMEDREILESEVESLLISLLGSAVLQETAVFIRQRLGRPLEAFDIWYTGFSSGGSLPESTLDERVKQSYPDVVAFERQLAPLLQGLGFSAERADYLRQYIRVDAARGAGHALGAKMRYDNAHLRTRVPAGGMDYKGFNTAMHELGHTVEQVFTLNDIDYYTLEGVPNTAFTEAFAFVFQNKDLQVLGMGQHTGQTAHLETLHTLWQTVEIAGVSLLDMRIWRWMYAHPDAGAQQLREAVIQLAVDIWNSYFAPLYGIKDQPILAIYSHILFCGMYIPDYAIGHLIAWQIETYLTDRNLATEMERMCKQGRLAPQVWMQKAIGERISAEALLTKAEQALRELH